MRMVEYLRNLYQNFLVFDRRYFLADVKKWLGVKNLKLNKIFLERFFDNYQKISFAAFLKDVKDIIYSKNIFDFIKNNAVDDWYLWYQLKFLEEENLIKITKGRVAVIKKEIFDLIPAPLSEEEIKDRIEKKLKIILREEVPVVDLFKNFSDFKVKAKFDQLPISQGSAVFVVKKILEYLPLNRKFLFVGDDDFISILLCLANPKIESVVVDIDNQLLRCIGSLAERLNLKIETKKIDVRKKESLGEGLVGFITNPVYTADGAEEFVRYGLSQLGKDGGFGFLEIGNEAIGNRFLFLQEFFAGNKLLIKELITSQIHYPWTILHKEDQLIYERLKAMGFDKKTIQKNPKLGASLYVFNCIPFEVKKLKFKPSIYSYL